MKTALTNLQIAPSRKHSSTLSRGYLKSKRSEWRKRTTSYMTQDGLATIRSRILELQQQRATLAQLLHFTRDFAGSEENSHYDALLSEQELIDQRIAHFQKLQKSAKIIVKNPLSATVELGSTVTVQTESYCQQLTIVGNSEVDLRRGFISHDSPVGKSLLGKQIGEHVEVHTPANSLTYTIITIT